MRGGNSHFHIATTQNHPRLITVSTTFLKVFGVSGEVEILALNGTLVDG